MWSVSRAVLTSKPGVPYSLDIAMIVLVDMQSGKQEQLSPAQDGQYVVPQGRWMFYYGSRPARVRVSADSVFYAKGVETSSPAVVVVD